MIVHRPAAGLSACSCTPFSGVNVTPEEVWLNSELMAVDWAAPLGSISSPCTELAELFELTVRFRAGFPAGMFTWYQKVSPVLLARPLPPVSVPVNDVAGFGVGTSERSVTGTVVCAAKEGTLLLLSRTMEPDVSPGCDGVATVRVKLPVPPGARDSELADSEPNCCHVAVLAPTCAVTLPPPLGAFVDS